MSDIIEGNVTPQIANAICNAGGKMLKVCEMSYKYGTRDENGEMKTIRFVPEED